MNTKQLRQRVLKYPLQYKSLYVYSCSRLPQGNGPADFLGIRKVKGESYEEV
jgi:hypothetical protein